MKLLIAEDASSGMACVLSLGLRKYVDLMTVWEWKSHYGMDYIDDKAVIGYHNLPKESDGLIIVGAGTYNRLKKYIASSTHKSITIIITDSWFMLDAAYYNKEFRNYRVFATPCKIKYRGDLPTREYYQPFNLSVDIVKNDKLTIAHSPFTKGKFDQKGTHNIISAMNGYNFDLITGVSWDESLQRKAKCHIFIDQVDFKGLDWIGGIGRSGYEGMILKCLVVSRGEYNGIEIPSPPIAWCTKDNFKDVVDFYIHNPSERNEIIEQQKDWADKYLDMDFQAKRILDGA